MAAAADRGRDLALQPPPPVFSQTPPGLTGENLRIWRGAARSSEDRGPNGSTVMEGDGGRSRTLRRSVQETAAAAIGVFVDTNPTRSGGSHEGVVPQEKDHNVVAEERPPGTASSLLEHFRRRQQIAYCQKGYGSCIRPGVYFGPVRRGDSARNTRPCTSSEEKELKGGSNANVADGGIGTQNSAGAGAENILHGNRDDLRRRRPHGRLRGAEGFFF